jgi:hypothetical protein
MIFYSNHYLIACNFSLKFVCAVEFEDTFLLGRLSLSKSAAKASAALALVYKLNLSEKLNSISNSLKRQNETPFGDSEVYSLILR